MRKKLLALMMCATMVLGTGMTAMAAVPSEDTFKAAETVFKNGSKFDAEYEGAKLVKFTTADKNTGKRSAWAFTADSKTPVKVGTDGDLKDKALVKVGTDVTGTFKTDANGYYVNAAGTAIAYPTAKGDVYYLVKERTSTQAKDGVVETSNTATPDKAAAIKAINPSASAAAVISVGGKDYAGYTTADGAQYLVDANGVRIAKVQAGKIVYDNTYVTYTASDLQVAEDGVYRLGNKLVYVENAGTVNAKSYDVDADGYIQKKDTATTNLFKADGSSVERTDDADAQYYVTFGQITPSTGALKTVAYALDEKSLSKDAVAIGVNLYEVVATNTKAANSDDYIMSVVSRQSVSTSTAITLDKDVLSRTGLKANNTLGVYTIDFSDTEKKDGSNVARLESLGTATVDGTFTFDVKDYTNGLLIFDGVADESQGSGSNNDGVADTTATAAATTNTEKSPVTGDVAPIAALAVVMMGACGAMVVASKKRA